MNMEASIIVAGVGIVATVVGSHVALRTEFKTTIRYLEEDVHEIKKKVLNGHFIRREECSHCRQHEKEE